MSHEQPGPSKKEEVGRFYPRFPSWIFIPAPTSGDKDAGFSVPVDIQRIEFRLLKLLDEFNSGNVLSFGSFPAFSLQTRSKLSL